MCRIQARSDDVLIWTTALRYSLVLRTALIHGRSTHGSPDNLAITGLFKPNRHPRLIKVILIEIIEVLIYFLTLSGLWSCSRLFSFRMFSEPEVRSGNETLYEYMCTSFDRKIDNGGSGITVLLRQYFIHISFFSQKLDMFRQFHLAKVKYVMKAWFDASYRIFHTLVYFIFMFILVLYKSIFK